MANDLEDTDDTSEVDPEDCDYCALRGLYHNVLTAGHAVIESEDDYGSMDN
jgi:hypothetical protein